MTSLRSRQDVAATHMLSGKWIRESREERFLRSSDVERISRSITDIKGNTDFYISHSSLADIENGSVPSIHKLFSLAACLKISLDDLLLVFGIDSNESRHFAVAAEDGRAPSEHIEAPQPSFNLQLNIDTNFTSDETSLLRFNPHELAILPWRCNNGWIQVDIGML
jgi:transcriptional regulator with XRE-family HTH domain